MLDNYIVDLLYENECVIIPGFGGFVVNYQPAFYDSKKNIFLPPKSKIAFNSRLTTNDGLLYNYLMQVMNISFEQARKEVNQFVEDIKKKLHNKQTVSIQGLGSFRLKHQLIFTADNTANFLTENYGLNSVLVYPVKKEIKVVKPKKVATVDITPVINYRKWLVAASVILSLSLIPHGFLNQSKYNSQSNLLPTELTNNGVDATLKDLYDQYPSLQNISNQIDELSDKKVALNPFTEQKTAKDIANETIETKETPPVIENKTEQETVNEEVAETKEPETTKPEPKEVKVENEQTSVSKGDICLIIGSFKDQNNANRFYKKMKKDYPAAILFNYNGFYRITSDIFKSKSKASQAKKELKAKGVSAWVMKYK